MTINRVVYLLLYYGMTLLNFTELKKKLCSNNQNFLLLFVYIFLSQRETNKGVSQYDFKFYVLSFLRCPINL